MRPITRSRGRGRIRSLLMQHRFRKRWDNILPSSTLLLIAALITTLNQDFSLRPLYPGYGHHHHSHYDGMIGGSPPPSPSSSILNQGTKDNEESVSTTASSHNHHQATASSKTTTTTTTTFTHSSPITSKINHNRKVDTGTVHRLIQQQQQQQQQQQGEWIVFRKSCFVRASSSW